MPRFRCKDNANRVHNPQAFLCVMPRFRCKDNANRVQNPPSLLVCYAEVPLNFCKVNTYFLQIGCKCHSQPSPSLFHGFFIRRPGSVSSLSTHSVPMSVPIQYLWVFHSVPMSVPFSANERLIQYQWGHHSLLLADIPPKTLGLTPPWHLPDTSLTPSWHLLDTSLTPFYDINDTDTVCYLAAWHLDT